MNMGHFNRLNPVRRSKDYMLKKSTFLDSVGEGEGGMIWENGIETCIISYMKWVSSPGSMHDTGCLGLVHWDDQRGGKGREEGGRFRMGNMCIPVADLCWYMAKPITIVKLKNFFKIQLSLYLISSFKLNMWPWALWVKLFFLSDSL